MTEAGAALAGSVPSGRMSQSGSFASILACPRQVRLRGHLGNADCPALRVEGIGSDVIQAPERGPRIIGMNSRTLNGLPSGRSFRTSRVAFAVLTTGAS